MKVVKIEISDLEFHCENSSTNLSSCPFINIVLNTQRSQVNRQTFESTLREGNPERASIYATPNVFITDRDVRKMRLFCVFLN